MVNIIAACFLLTHSVDVLYKQHAYWYQRCDVRSVRCQMVDQKVKVQLVTFPDWGQFLLTLWHCLFVDGKGQVLWTGKKAAPVICGTLSNLELLQKWRPVKQNQKETESSCSRV